MYFYDIGNILGPQYIHIDYKYNHELRILASKIYPNREYTPNVKKQQSRVIVPNVLLLLHVVITTCGYYMYYYMWLVPLTTCNQ